MLDLDVVVMNGDALDDQLQECLTFGDADALQSRTDALAECSQVVQDIAGMNLLLA